MKSTILAASAALLLTTAPAAFAQQTTTEKTTEVPGRSEKTMAQDAEQGVGNATRSAERGAENATQGARDAAGNAGQTVEKSVDQGKSNANREMSGDDKKPGLDDGNKTADSGSNSFTEGQARSRMEAQGFTQVTGLKKDPQGVWTGQAMQNGKQVQVQLDYEGDVVVK